jgi:hypothetical protein
MANSIIIKCYTKVQEEITATAVAIRPGMLLELTSTGLVQAHSGAAADVLPMFALEDELQGRGIDTNYGVSTKVQVWIPRRGDIVNALLADGETAAIGSYLESNGAGALQVYSADEPSDTQYPANLVGQAIEAVDLSDSANLTALGRIQVRIL